MAHNQNWFILNLPEINLNEKQRSNKQEADWLCKVFSLLWFKKIYARQVFYLFLFLNTVSPIANRTNPENNLACYVNFTIQFH